MVAAGENVLAAPELRRLKTAAEGARAAVADYRTWLEGTLIHGTDDWALGRERYDELVSLRAFDGLDADAILQIGQDQLALNRAARVSAAREIDPKVDEPTVVGRIKSDHPATFAAALDAYREVMFRARQHLIDRDIVTVPDDERIEVIPTPEYIRNVIPFAAYFDPPKFDANPSGIYIVTPSVGNDPNAMREQGFDDAPNFRLNMYTDAIWRACRIILDVRMHRGEIGVDDAIRFMVEQTSFEEPNARAEVLRYTYTPTYQLSYLLGKVLLLQLRADESARLGSAFSLRRFHDALMRNASLPISFQRRLLAGDGGGTVLGGGSGVDRAAAR